MLIAVEQVSDSIRLNLLDMERCDIVSFENAMGSEIRASARSF